MHRQFCFSNCLATNERIFIKFKTVSIPVNQYIDFHDDPCTHAHVRDKIMHSYSIRLYFNRMHGVSPYVRMCGRIIMKISMLIGRYTDSLSYKFYDDPFIGCREIDKTLPSMHYSHF